MTAWEFVHDHPFLAFFAVLAAIDGFVKFVAVVGIIWVERGYGRRIWRNADKK